MCRSVAIPCAFAIAACVLTGSAAQAQDDPFAPLQGRWIVTGAEHHGKPMNNLKGGVMVVIDDTFEIRTASGNMLKGTLRLDTSNKPFRMDMIHADGTEWEAIYEVARGKFRINYVEKGQKDPRPSAFVTSPATEESLIILGRQDR